MDTTRSLFALIASEADITRFGKTERLHLGTLTLLLALACTAGWGALVGISSHHALIDAVLAPVLLLASALAALPLALFVGRVFGKGARVGDLFMAYSAGAFAGAMALVLVAPLVALYQHSSAVVGAHVGPWSAALGCALGFVVFLRTLGRLAPAPDARRAVIVPAILLLVLQTLALSQLASVMPPLFEARTRIGHGIDGVPGIDASGDVP